MKTSFPHSAQKYLNGTDENGNFNQEQPTLLVSGEEPNDVCCIREQSNSQKIHVLLIANGHTVVLNSGYDTNCPTFSEKSSENVLETCSPYEEGQVGAVHWDTYMPIVPDKDYAAYQPGRKMFTKGSLSGSAVAGDRSITGEYCGARVISRLKALNLPYPEEHEEGVFRTS